MEYIPATGAHESNYDVRTIKHDSTLAVPLDKGGYTYSPQEIEHQHRVGICTSISLVQNAEKVYGKKYSPDFQYLLQKKYYDNGWFEGSSIFNALKVGKNYGFLPIELFPYVTENDRNLSYENYAFKLQTISDSEINRLLSLCENKLTGYASVDVNGTQAIAKAILDSKAGILCRYTAGNTWYTAPNGMISWATKDIDPIRNPTQDLSGHAIGTVYFDYTNGYMHTLANTWGTDWNDQNKGNAHINWSNYKMTEAWIPYYGYTPDVPAFKYNFVTDMKYNQTSKDVMALQQALSTLGYFTITPTGYYGNITADAVYAFQKDRVDMSWYERYVIRGTRTGPKTRAILNSLFNK